MHSFRVMTFNIRCDTIDDGPHTWVNRRPLVMQTVRDHDPDLLGVQEATVNQWTEIAAALPAFTPFGLPERAPLEMDLDVPAGFVRSTRFEVLERGLFWLSDTPHEPGTITWPNDWGARMCCWARLQDRKMDRRLILACTHVDTNAAGWLPSARVLHAELDTVAAGVAIVLVGDFNCAAGGTAHKYLRESGRYRDAWNEAGLSDDGVVTFNGFSPDAGLANNEGHSGKNYRIDWILIRGAIRCVSATIDQRTDRGLFPSDHYPVVAQVEWDDTWALPSSGSRDLAQGVEITLK
jgi:endonuclease/exonuclease/phosphatase family metal-dependent hydrolase